jgi:hypothetical protein
MSRPCSGAQAALTGKSDLLPPHHLLQHKQVPPSPSPSQPLPQPPTQLQMRSPANEEPDPLPPPTVSTARAKAEQAHCQYAEAVQLYSTALAPRWYRSTLRLLGAARNDPGCIAGGAAGGQRTHSRIDLKMKQTLSCSHAD